MAFKTWHTGVHIQQDKVLAVALVREKSGWGLRRWWQLPLAAGIIRDGQILQPEQLAAALREWRCCLINIKSFSPFRLPALYSARFRAPLWPCATANRPPGSPQR